MTRRFTIKRDNRSSIVNARGPTRIVTGAQGPRGPAGPVAVPIERIVTDAGDVAVLSTDEAVHINKTVDEPTDVFLPPSATVDNPITIHDRKFDCATNNITIHGDDSETVMGGSSFVMDSNGMSITLRPYTDGSGWY